MKHFGIDLSEGSDIENLTVPSGTAYPGLPSVGELFFRTDFNALVVYNGSAWSRVQTQQSIPVACSDETTALTTGLKVTFRMPYAMTLVSVKASLTTAQASGNIFTVDITSNGTSIFSTLLTIDNSETTSGTAVTPAVLSTTSLSADAEIKISITQAGTGGTGLKVYLIGVA